MKTNTQRRFILMAIAIVGSLLSSCSHKRALMSDLTTNQSKWASQKISHYRYTFGIGAMNPSETVVIEVNNGVRASLTCTSGIIYSPERFIPYDTLDKIFKTADDTINSSRDDIKIKYDPAYGYPTEITSDDKQATDTFEGYYVSHFEVLN